MCIPRDILSICMSYPRIVVLSPVTLRTWPRTCFVQPPHSHEIWGQFVGALLICVLLIPPLTEANFIMSVSDMG